MEGLNRIFKKNENFVFRKIEDETILVPIKDNVGDMGSLYNLNEVAAFVWEQLNGEKSLQDIKNRLLEEYDVPAEEAENDLSQYIAQLKEIDAITRAE
jgi:methyltransferase-like protein